MDALNRLGTPTDLKEAIARGLSEILVEPINRDHRHVKYIHDVIQDRLSQSFQTEICKPGGSIMELWWSIFPSTKRSKLT